jgi:3-deoxy-7-phosphoheptulonate synthase
MITSEWQPDSWRLRTAAQQPVYDDPAGVDDAVAMLSGKPPVVAPGEVDRLRADLALASEGRRFVLQGGDCAERFEECTGPSLTRLLQVLLQMSLVLTYATRKPVIRIGRIAGQYAKPRSKATELVDGAELPVYRGDLINDMAPTAEARRADPRRMVEGYHHATASLNFIRGLIEGGFADLHHPEQWELDFIEQSSDSDAYQKIIDAITDAVTFMKTVGEGGTLETLRRVSFYTSHEALLLPYEEAMTRSTAGQWHNLGAHFLWLGYRTCQKDGAHVEYLRGVRNPIGIKVGPNMPTDDLVEILDRIDPDREPGRVTLITRFGAERVGECLPAYLHAVGQAGHPVLWLCDPMHGNTRPTADGQKTRLVTDIFSELERTFEMHASVGTCLGGVHFELTGSPVTECVGGSGGVRAQQLGERYQTACDPRLNGAQALEMAFLIARLLR